MQRSIRKISSTLAVATFALVFSGFASAGSRDAHVNVSKAEVSYSDLDLRLMPDATQLYGRIERAARDVCRTGDGASARAHELQRKCVAQAISTAVESVGNANLTTVYATRSAKLSMVASSR